MKALPRIIPLFPLPNVVLFPQMPLALHVFEPRYRKMVEDALAGSRTIGMMLLRPGWEPEYQGRPPVYEVGCAGVIEQSEPLEGGRYNIGVRGTTRFHILAEHEGEPYRLATVEPRADLAGEGAALEEMRRRVLAAIGKALDGPASLVLQEELPHDLFVNALCQTMTLSPVERQSLLDCDTILARYARLIEIMDFMLLERTHSRQGGDG